ncbi:hypothetical protein Dalk_1301 [Desulfatibacillum aliphaticivorans]|uniref:Uncharacterized protein n=1 Tax=Desulfatibacillum aliphaticivorans TaxID=218208 RepID=B8F9Q8_DESAL|nr:hypothetical protein [Desulfatibacillum aliphaticivorans]ACL03004.1 hypothetical protein Dalk_1301 [Desulfatibacillum aliphaticivorans]
MTKNSKKNALIMDENQVEHNPETTLAEEQNQESSLSTASDTESGTEDETEGDLENGDTEENLVDSTSPDNPPEPEEPQGLAVPQMQPAASEPDVISELGGGLIEDGRHYRPISDSTSFHGLSSFLKTPTSEPLDVTLLRDEMAEFNAQDAKTLIEQKGAEEALDIGKKGFLAFYSKISRLETFSEGGMFLLRLEQSKATEKLREICKEAGFDFNVKVIQAMPQISIRSLKDYERLLKYKDIYKFLPLGKNRAVSLIAVMEKDAGKGKKKAQAWQGETPIRDYLAKHNIAIPTDAQDQKLEIFRWRMDVLINTRRASHEKVRISQELLQEFTRECGEMKRNHFQDLTPYSGDEEALKDRLEEYKANEGKIPPLDTSPDKVDGVIKKLDGILKDDGALGDISPDKVETLKAKVTELEQKLAESN